ncbi:MAG TPA: 1-acyl-sn-glycerol-3-phosphate acyltransferase, partial [Candidatus Xenobia bacterium]
ETVQTLFLAVFSIGVGVGSILCEKLSFDRLELGLIPIGSVGMTLFLFDLCRSWHGKSGFSGHYLDWMDLLHSPDGSHVTFNLAMIALFSGFYIVPLYTFIQARAEAAVRSRVVAANNIINSLFMAVWSGIQIALLKFYDPIHVLMILAVLNVVVAFYIYTVIPEFTIRFVIYLLVHLVYRVRVKNLAYIPHEGAAVLVCNHVTFVDWFIISGVVRRPIRFTMYHGYSKLPILSIFMRQAHVIPLASHKEDPALLERAMDRIAEELSLGELVCIFPEGALTKDGEIAQFRKGIERIVERTPVPVIPMALQGLWGSFFSRQDNQAFKRPFRHGVWTHVGLQAGPPVAPADVTADGLREMVLQLRDNPA